MSKWASVTECDGTPIAYVHANEQAARDALRLMNFGGCGPGCKGPKFHYIRRHRSPRRSVLGGLLVKDKTR